MGGDKPQPSGALFDLLQRLEAASIYYGLGAPTLGCRAIMVSVTVPGERWEVEFSEDGTVQTEVFVSRRGVEAETTLEELFERFSN